ncbi:conserved hypothetical protein [uncultured Desulfatiglans sp.]|uniref:Uncharacterized protein n=1 Tax=Uncultured Desulfatiglans sp. TaxID=1748965 RepID=A0A653AI95_UNCDX|nr:conserved hypothetical protein [uncultured Desulfatiglans sp.]
MIRRDAQIFESATEARRHGGLQESSGSKPAAGLAKAPEIGGGIEGKVLQGPRNNGSPRRMVGIATLSVIGREPVMDNRFHIGIHRNSENLHLRLEGDFDKNSACELLHTLQRLGCGSRQVFIHTTCLGHIDPFGRDLFLHHLGDINTRSLNLRFTGEYAAQIAPERTAHSDGNESSGTGGFSIWK